jgi:hypothetical protein
MQLTNNDFAESGCEEVIANCNDKECNYYRSHFWNKAREAKDSNDEKTEELFRLLGDICSLHLRLDSPEQPFGPMMTSSSGRTAIAEDFTDDEIRFFEDIVAEVADADLRARIADVLWVRKRNYVMAELAVSSYL